MESIKTSMDIPIFVWSWLVAVIRMNNLILTAEDNGEFEFKRCFDGGPNQRQQEHKNTL